MNYDIVEVQNYEGRGWATLLESHVNFSILVSNPRDRRQGLQLMILGVYKFVQSCTIPLYSEMKYDNVGHNIKKVLSDQPYRVVLSIILYFDFKYQK